MQAVVPAAGKGTRMGHLTADQPKALVEVAGKPLLTHCFETLATLDVTELVVVVGHHGDDVRDQYASSFAGIPITYVAQPAPRGLGDALSRAGTVLQGDFLHLNGDNVCDANVDELAATHQDVDADVTMLVEEVSTDRAREGGVLAFDEEGAVASIVEKPDEPPSTTIPRGCYAFSERILDACEALEPGHTGEYELSAAIDRVLDRGGTVETVPLDGWFVNVNTPADVAVAERLRSGRTRPD